ncbi:hypothetical protein BCV72DRAFT_240262 [Rhizopus microsporus var. microsporus]|uniref:Reticulon-like protein n=2 Tax=Rhizopus microsporus TaxID=58291 RepID=A0A2G4T8Z7_RHIZD|nr:uncharacterized protein RHIMIDRAFT_243550 [Rhizopus microsporus ATCC 52813]ORE08703.1 hypothetical protein BCV72DRAFT_240262 [Rhizopus microsporus var. microsporus]PHZ17487.1 hypothetical protein RHIMIDRAFT_243550 [Rhizopus microsporus ATCC 52813]
MHILRWDKPFRSSVLFLSLMSIIYLVQSYSIVQIILCTLTLTTVINFVYVYAVKFFQKISSNTSFKHPFVCILDNENRPILNKERILYYVSSSVDLADAVIRVVTKIILVENPKKSALWLIIFLTSWKVSGQISTFAILKGIIISAFITPCLYASNQKLVNARIQQLQGIINTDIKIAQEYATEKVKEVKHTCTKKAGSKQE